LLAIREVTLVKKCIILEASLECSNDHDLLKNTMIKIIYT